MKILIVLNYYVPYISGLTEAARSVAEALAENHEVTVLTAKHQSSLKDEETVNGVRVVRAPVLLRVSKGYISPAFIRLFLKLSKDADIVNLHLPMIESGLFGLLTPRNKLVTTYQCDVNLNKSVLNKVIEMTMDLTCRIALSRSSAVVVSSEDYAKHSRVLPRFQKKWKEIHPVSPAYSNIPEPVTKKTDSRIIVGFCGRIVEEKGINILLKAVPIIRQQLGNVEFRIVGSYDDVAGGSIFSRLKEEIGWDPSYVKFLGKVSQQELYDFYSSISLLVLPSINSLEAFGMVQVEAMLAGVPVVASNLPGVREIPTRTGMGLVVEPKDVEGLASAVVEVALNKSEYIKDRAYIESLYGTGPSTKKYIYLFESILNRKSGD
ncbi:glycosyltransferase family 4 protein [Paenibacillus humicus]|uniref:glycosyltransferase family 4 protein n=1 Tax=Paenibacillus humicus TaxID=412861 RepID=UPI000FDA05B9|nr:glycosyltransferase family 4 protein [Paenibacillus humicus]